MKDLPKILRRAIKISLLGVASFPLIYVGLYCVLVELPARFRIPWTPFSRKGWVQVSYMAANGKWQRFPDYRGLPDWLFAPIHEYDRIHLRPEMWRGTYLGNRELTFDWLNGKVPFESDLQ